ncbi:MAG TPA: hypothetical protein PKD78_12870, partial [Saprospiraceae bacterium]|nr:hypothetical protein [Saprospiraceae bacterium]
ARGGGFSANCRFEASNDLKYIHAETRAASFAELNFEAEKVETPYGFLPNMHTFARLFQKRVFWPLLPPPLKAKRAFAHQISFRNYG